MGDLDDALPAIAADAILAAGETVYYKPAGGSDREIEAVVNRNPADVQPGAGAGIGPNIEITVVNDSTTGIASSEIDLGGDTVKLAVRIGNTTEYRAITKIISQDAGFLTLGVR